MEEQVEVLLLVQLEHKAEKREEQKLKELRELKTSYLRRLGNPLSGDQTQTLYGFLSPSFQ